MHECAMHLIATAFQILDLYTHLEIPAWGEAEHGLEVLAVVPHPVYPHDGHKLKHGDDDDGHPGAVGVHQVEHVLAALGQAGQPQEEAAGAQQARDAGLVVPGECGMTQVYSLHTSSAS